MHAVASAVMRWPPRVVITILVWSFAAPPPLCPNTVATISSWPWRGAAASPTARPPSSLASTTAPAGWSPNVAGVKRGSGGVGVIDREHDHRRQRGGDQAKLDDQPRAVDGRCAHRRPPAWILTGNLDSHSVRLVRTVITRCHVPACSSGARARRDRLAAPERENPTVITTAAATSPIRIGVVEPPPLLWEATEGTPLPAWIGCPSAAAIRADGDRPRLGEIGARLARWLGQRGDGLLGDRGKPLGAVSVVHHDKQPLRTKKRDLPVEEVGVFLGLAEQAGDHAEVRGCRDQRDLDLDVGLLRGGGHGVERPLCRRRHRRVERIEDVRAQQDVAGGVAIGERRGRDADGDQQRAKDTGQERDGEHLREPEAGGRQLHDVQVDRR